MRSSHGPGGRPGHAVACMRAWVLAAALCAALSAQAGQPRLHVPSPDWRDQVVYFVVTDRFDDGDPRNNDQRAGEYRPGDRTRYQGGDLAGLTRRLDYIRGLGATAVWLTPPVANQWLSPDGGYGGYHGYWAADFTRVDAHLGTLADYQRLARELHRRDMYLVQDIVLNHTGNFFDIDRQAAKAGGAGADAGAGYRAHLRTPPAPRPTQPPFHLNDPRRAADRRAAIYHWTPEIADYTSEEQRLNGQLSGLDDLNTESPAVRRALRASYGGWIRRAGVDAFRIDTAMYVPHAAIEDFLRSGDRRAPGIEQVARSTGRSRFHLFGETFVVDRAFDETQSRRVESYATDARGRPLLPGMLGFPLYGALGDAFARGRPTAELAWRIESIQRVHRDPGLMVNFIDNHDVDRFLANGTEAGLQQALLALFTLPGIPAITYGTEQGLRESRASMFAAGWGSGGRDRFDAGAPLYRRIAELAALRRDHAPLRRGRVLAASGSAAGPGVVAWRMAEPGRDEGSLLVALNTREGEALAANVPTQLPAGTVLEPVFGLHGRPAALVTGAGGQVSFTLPARGGQVWRVTAQAAGVPAATGAPAIDPVGEAVARSDFTVSGRARPGQRLRLVVDDDLAGASETQADAAGRWQARIDTGSMIDPRTPHRLVAWDGLHASAPTTFRVEQPWRAVLEVADPAGDDHGPDGRYVYPTDAGWGDNRQLDIRGVRVSTAGGALRVELQMNRVTRGWNPTHGFDRVAFTVFIELPGREGGARAMPLQNAELPAGMRWHLRHRTHGWSNALYDWRGAGADAEGTPAGPAPAIHADAATGTVTFTYPAAALGSPASLSGARVLVTTWDYDSGYRALAPSPGPYVFGGGAAGAAKVMDDSGVLVLP